MRMITGAYCTKSGTLISLMIKPNPFVLDVSEPPIAEAVSWLRPESFGDDTALLDVCQAVPGYPPHESLRQHISRVVMDGDNAFYTDIEGIPALRQSLAADVTGFYGGSVNPEDVLISAGCNQAFMLSIMALCEAGSSVILPSPWYFNHKMTLDMLNVSTVELPCRSETGMVPDLGEVGTS